MGKNYISLKHLIQKKLQTLYIYESSQKEVGGKKVMDLDFLNKTNLDLMSLYLVGFVYHGFIFCNLMDFWFSQEEAGLKEIM